MADERRLTGRELEFCRNLRTKRYYISDKAPATYLREGTATTGYWCLRTMGVFGPDDGYACPDACGPSRSCYKSSVVRQV